MARNTKLTTTEEFDQALRDNAAQREANATEVARLQKEMATRIVEGKQTGDLDQKLALASVRSGVFDEIERTLTEQRAEVELEELRAQIAADRAELDDVGAERSELKRKIEKADGDLMALRREDQILFSRLSALDDRVKTNETRLRKATGEE